jgi:hypothetical protein
VSTLGKQLLSSIVQSRDIHQYLQLGLEAYLFRGEEIPFYEYISNHVVKYGAIPDAALIEDQPGLETALVLAPQPSKFYLDEVQKQYLGRTLGHMMAEANVLLKPPKGSGVKPSPEAAFDVVMHCMTLIYQQQNRKSLTDFRNAEEGVKADYVKQQVMGGEVALPFGWPTLDARSGGMRAGDFITFVGRTNAGKTFQMLYTALNAWDKGKTVLFVSMEMLIGSIQQRLAAMKTQTKLTDLMKAELSTAAVGKLFTGLHKLKDAPNPLWMVDMAAVSNVNDLLLLIQVVNPGIVFIDGAYLLDSTDSKLSKWDGQAHVARELKKAATSFGFPIVASYQLSKAYAKGKKGKPKGDDDIGTEDFYGSDEIPQLSSVALALVGSVDDVSFKKRKTVKILKARDSENVGSFLINWNFSSKMDFSEAEPDDVKTMQLNTID